MSWYLFKFILAISLDLCHDFWSCTFCHGNHIIPVPSPPSRPHPRPLSFVWNARIKVPMMHGATTSTVSSASTPVTNVPFAESAASNQVCSFSSLCFRSGGSEICAVSRLSSKLKQFRRLLLVPCVVFAFHLSALVQMLWCQQEKRNGTLKKQKVTLRLIISSNVNVYCVYWGFLRASINYIFFTSPINFLILIL